MRRQRLDGAPQFWPSFLRSLAAVMDRSRSPVHCSAGEHLGTLLQGLEGILGSDLGSVVLGVDGENL